MLNKLNKLKLASIASVALAASGFALPATATDNYGYGYYEGCTPGYWKQYHHEDSWPEVYYEYNYVGYDPYQTVQSVFYAVKDYDLKLIEALKGRGGGEIALLRHAVAGILNAENKFVKYKYTPNPA